MKALDWARRGVKEEWGEGGGRLKTPEQGAWVGAWGQGAGSSPVDAVPRQHAVYTAKAPFSPNRRPQAPEAEARRAGARGKEESGHEPENPRGPGGKSGSGEAVP